MADTALATLEFIEELLLKEIKPKFQNDPLLKSVIVWVEKFDVATGFLKLGFAMGQGTGCSPFCGCAASQLADLVGEKVQEKFVDVKKVRGVAALPTKEIVDTWNNA